MTTQTPWRDKANRLIYRLCEAEYKKANPKPLLSWQRHKPYHVPQLAKDLVECLDTDDEHRAKAIFLSYEGMKALSI